MLNVECSFLIRAFATLCLSALVASAETVLFTDAVVHTVTRGTIMKGAVLVQSNQITGVYDLSNSGGVKLTVPADATFINLKGQHL